MKCASAQQLLGFVLFYSPSEETKVPGLGDLLVVNLSLKSVFCGVW